MNTKKKKKKTINFLTVTVCIALTEFSSLSLWTFVNLRYKSFSHIFSLVARDFFFLSQDCNNTEAQFAQRHPNSGVLLTWWKLDCISIVFLRGGRASRSRVSLRSRSFALKRFPFAVLLSVRLCGKSCRKSCAFPKAIEAIYLVYT